MTGAGPGRAGWLLRVWGPAAAMMAALFLVSADPSPPQPAGLPDVAAHAAAYAVLGSLLLRAVAGARWSGVTAGAAGLAVVLAAAYGLTDEYHQTFVPGRTASWRDAAADAAGAASGALAVWAWGRWRSGRGVSWGIVRIGRARHDGRLESDR